MVPYRTRSRRVTMGDNTTSETGDMRDEALRDDKAHRGHAAHRGEDIRTVVDDQTARGGEERR
jgi:hypothetical protein